MNTQCWNHGWKFWEETDAFSLVWSVPETARVLDLPHDAMLERQSRPESPNGGDTGYRDGGNYVYVKEFTAPEAWRQQTVMVHFEAVYSNAMVYLNGQLVGKRPYGYAPFTVPLNDYLRYGGSNELRVLVKNNGMPNSRWYSGSGIIRDVWLLTGGRTYLPYGTLKVSVSAAQEDYAALKVAVTVENRDCLSRSLCLRTRILDGDGETAAVSDLPLTLPGGKQETIGQTLTVPDPVLWSAEQPVCYRCQVELCSEGEVLDRAETEFGIRTLSLDSRRGLQVNGRTVKLRGACIHHDNGLLGAVSREEAELRRVRILKEAGFNALRIAHNPASSALLRACDRLGMYVMDEAFDMWSRPKKDNDYALFLDKWWQEDLAAMVERDFNHPSVLLYSLGNEIPEAGMAQGSRLGRDMARLAKSLDPTRFVLVAINGVFAAGDCVPEIMGDVLSGAGDQDGGGGNVNDFMSAMDAHLDDIVVHPRITSRIDAASVGMDLVGYNYMTARYVQDAEQYPHRVIVGSETYPPQIPRNWTLVQKLPSVIGDFTWTGWDYLGEAGVGVPAYHFGEGGFGAQFPCQLAYVGDVDITGFRRPASYFREIVFGLRKQPYIVVQNPARYGEPLIKTPWVISDSISSWTFTGFAGKPVVVEVYAPGDQVELFQDGVSLGKKPCGAATGYITCFETSYRPGRLEAVAYENGLELGRMELATAGALSRIHLALESPPAGELVYVGITLEDSRQRVVTDQDLELQAGVSGGDLAGFGSGDPKPAYSYLGNVTRTFQGRALAILHRRAGESVTLRISGGGLEQSITIA